MYKENTLNNCAIAENIQQTNTAKNWNEIDILSVNISMLYKSMYISYLNV